MMWHTRSIGGRMCTKERPLAMLLHLMGLLIFARLSSSQDAVDPCTTGDTYGGSGNPAACKFPFIYKEVSYDECTKVDNGGKLWCATTSNYDEDKLWGNCRSTMDTVGGSANPARCVFPFKYRNKMYDRCTDIRNDGVEWCATTSNYDRHKQWGNCREGGKTTYGGTANPARCVFPFTYRGETYRSCTKKRNNGVEWCATTNNYPEDKKWGNCRQRTYGGTANPAKCVFPFYYQESWYSECTDKNNFGIAWCATTDNYPGDRAWANCVIDC